MATLCHATLASAQEGTSQAPPVEPHANDPGSRVGGHVGIATPLVTVSDDTTTIADQFTILNPIGIGIKLGGGFAIDFETVVATPIEPDGVTGLVVDPGVIYDLGPAVVGLRAAFQINSVTNFGLIPLVNKGLVDVGNATWFVEAAFPTFYAQEEVAFNVVLHTGFGF